MRHAATGLLGPGVRHLRLPPPPSLCGEAELLPLPIPTLFHGSVPVIRNSVPQPEMMDDGPLVEG